PSSSIDQLTPPSQPPATGNSSVNTRTMVIDVGFTLVSQNPSDTLRTVLSAQIHLPTGALTQVFPVRLYQLGRRYAEGDTLSDFSHLTDADAILDPVKNTIDRHLEAATQRYHVPASCAPNG